MSKKWSQKGIKSSLNANDEFMIIDSTDANPATRNKRLTVFTARDSFTNGFEFQTIGAATQSKTLLFNGAISALILIVASNAGVTKGYSANIMAACTVTTLVNNIAVNPISDFATADITVSSTSNSFTINMNGEAGETIDWKGVIYLIGI